MRLGGTVELVVEKPMSFRWIMEGDRVTGAQWTAPSNGILTLLTAVVTVQARGQNGSAVQCIEKQP